MAKGWITRAETLTALAQTLRAWEGFNLPLAEMFWLGKPALAFDVAAHPEVVFDRWYLAAGVQEMAAKAAWVLQGAIGRAAD